MSKRVVVAVSSVGMDVTCPCGNTGHIVVSSWFCADCKITTRAESLPAAETAAEDHRRTVHGKKRTRLVQHEYVA